MNKIISNTLCIAAVAFLAASCDVSGVGTLYEADPNVPGLSFLQSSTTDTEVSASAETFEIVLGRQITDKELTVSLTSTFAGDVVCPSSVTFAKGEGQAVITLDIKAMSVGKTYSGVISVADTTLYHSYGISELTVKLAKAFTWLEYGECKYTDDIIGSVFGLDPTPYTVTVEKAEGFDIYRLIDPYGAKFPYNEPGDWKDGAVWVIDCTNPDAVTFDKTPINVDWGYGQMQVAMLAPGKMVNKVVTFPVQGLVLYMGTSGYYGNQNGGFKLDLNI